MVTLRKLCSICLFNYDRWGKINNKKPTIALANDVIKDVIYYAQPTEVTIKNIIEEVSKAFGISVEDIQSNKKKAEMGKKSWT